MLTWITASGGLMAHEDLEDRIALKARETLGACCPEAVVCPSHARLRETQEPTYFGGGLYFNLQIATPDPADVQALLLQTIRKQASRPLGDIVRRFRQDFDMLPAVVFVNPNHGMVVPKDAVAQLRALECIEARFVLTHRIAREMVSTYGRRPETYTQSHILHAEEAHRDAA